MAYVSVDVFNQFDKNISAAVIRAEANFEAMITELRSTTVTQHGNQVEMQTQMAAIMLQMQQSEIKTNYLESARAELTTKVDVIEQIKTFITQSDEKFNTLSTQ